MDNKIEYKVLEPHDDPNHAKIGKYGDVVEFTADEVKNNLAYAYKKRREIQAMWTIAEATKKNIERTNPEVLEMDEKTLVAAFLYREQVGIANECERKLAEIAGNISEDENALRIAAEQTGLDIAPQVVPENPGETAPTPEPAPEQPETSPETPETEPTTENPSTPEPEAPTELDSPQTPTPEQPKSE